MLWFSFRGWLPALFGLNPVQFGFPGNRIQPFWGPWHAIRSWSPGGRAPPGGKHSKDAGGIFPRARTRPGRRVTESPIAE